MVAVALFVAFVGGALVVIGVEVVVVLFVIRKLRGKTVKEDVKVVQSGSEELQFQYHNNKNVSFPPFSILISGMICFSHLVLAYKSLVDHPYELEFTEGSVWVLEKEKIPKSSQSTEVTPTRKHASIKEKSLVIIEPDGTHTKVSLLGCIVEAVSAWAKTHPIKVENKSSAIYHGSKLFYMYFETSCEKESWCKALRLASCDDKEKLIWFYKARVEFHSYLASLNIEYPSFLKPSIGFNPEIGDRSIKLDGSSSKVRHLLKKLAKKTSKTGSENSVGGSSNHSQRSDTNSNDKVSSDDGTSCCNLLISRLFFDAKSNVDLRNSIQAQIQIALSAIRTPSYIGEIICTGVNPGTIPPYIHGMRVLPLDLKGVVAMEIDIEYYGGAVLDIETRLELQELLNQDPKSMDDATTDILDGFEYNGEVLKLYDQAMDQKGDGIRKFVSQVPLSLAIRVTTLQGTLRVHIKPPPSDQIWFGFTSMPDIDFSLESSIGDHKITNEYIVLFIISKFKEAICETMVLPNYGSVTIPFMIAEKDEWVPQEIAPFIWTNLTTEPHNVHASSTETTHDKMTLNQSDDDEMLLENDQLSPLPRPMVEENNETMEGDDAKLRRIGKRAKMLRLGKKMGDKLEEKRRNLEEKGRHIAEKMRGV
ncbi:hypothetical protein L1987_52644 [Smallanthus sonchifolius]|uniref:Uncharacterized protein n=1 Tax=Smallanthus sonchifolius TaxID=185202 RepID=A0ACB9ET51_9ASTR|nr:hypothetical protein L1987_52644 [Smallanthus sonchifolius]